MKHTPKSLILRCLVILLGTIVAAFGCASFVSSALPWAWLPWTPSLWAWAASWAPATV